MLKYMLDTDICIYTIKRKPPHIKRLFNAHVGQMCISAVTLAELYFGAENSSHKESNLAVVEGFASRLDVLEFDKQASYQYGQVRTELQKKGKSIGPYDMQIAAHARSQGLILVTNNLGEFSRVDGLRLENWTEDK